MRPWRGIAAMILAVSAIADAKAQGTISSLPRKETLIVENPEGTIKNAGWFNIWSINAGGQSTGLHQLAMDTFWYIDPQKGVDAMWMMPKHVFEKVPDILKFDNNPPVTLGAYTLNSFDPNGKWFIWQKRPDWQRTSVARFGEPGPKYVAYVDPGPPDKRVIAQLNHDLDIIH